ncbi:AAA family ATPase [Patescibacteria group bacterium]|nr:AAA family ATPase [Patescibacteria group bacterium]
MIIGITGTLGAGKGTVAQYLAKKHNFMYLSVRNFIAGEILKRGLAVNRDTMTQVANDLRALHGPNYLVEELLKQAKLHPKNNIVIESIRSVGEEKYLKSQSTTLWAVDADINTRYKRIVGRASETDAVSFEKFKADEDREMESNDPNKQNLKAVIAMAGVVLINNGTPEELFVQVEKALQQAP